MSQPKTTYLKDYAPSDYIIETVDLFFNLEKNNTEVRAQLRIKKNLLHDNPNADLVLNGEALELISLKLNDNDLSSNEYQLNKASLILPNVPDEFTLTIENRINPGKNTALSGLYVSRDIFCTQCEAEGFRRITYFLDRPDVLARYTTTIVADKDKFPILLSNGNKIASKTLENNMHSVTWEDPFKKPCYLFALVAGDLESIEDEFITRSKRKINLQIFSEKGEKEKCYHAMTSLKKAMKWDEEAYGREYDLDIYMVAVIDDFNMGAMENKGLNIFNSQTLLADPNIATDQDYNYVTKVVGHEYFHNWTGNRITCRDWFQLSLKEGLTVFREQEFSETIGDASLERINTVKQLTTLQFPEDSGPLAHPVQPDSYIEINNFYTMTIYEKGAELIRMMKTLVGDENFQKGMNYYFQHYDGHAATIEDFIHSIEIGSNYDLKAFRLWYKQAGTPILQIKTHYDEKYQTFTLNITQNCAPTPNQPFKKPLYFPLVIALLNQEGKLLPLHLTNETQNDQTQCTLIIKEHQQQFTFQQISSKPIPSVLRNFSAPVKLEIDYSHAELALILENDTDGFNRWNAAQELAKRIVLDQINQEKKEQHPAIPLLLNAYHALLTQQTCHEGFIAETLNLPSELWFAEQMNPIDVDGIYRFRNELRKHIANHLKDLLFDCYKTYQNFKPYEYSTVLQAKRSIKNLALNYLMLIDKDSRVLCYEQYQKSNNLTDRLAALSELINHAVPEAETYLHDFYEKWKESTLVVCKWLALQARAPIPNALDRVKKLLNHPGFDWKNPNKIRSLIGVFCLQNPTQFHQRSGAGYRFLREQIQRLDHSNPQIAARLVKPLTNWRCFSNPNKELMRKELEILFNTHELSPDTYEMVSKALQD